MKLLFLIVIFTVLLLLSLFKLKFEIIQPFNIFIIGYIVSISCAVCNINKWDINFSNKAFLLLLFGALEFFLISCVINLIFKRKNKQAYLEKGKQPQIKIDNWKIVLTSIYSIVTIALLVYNIKNIASHYGVSGSFSKILNTYRYNVSYSGNVSLPKYLILLLKPLFGAAYIFLYIIIYNFVNRENNMKLYIKENMLYILPIVTYIIQNLVNSARLNILYLIFTGLIMYIIMLYQKKGWNTLISLKKVVVLFVVVLIGSITFYFSGKLIGRNINESTFDYITMYAGGSIQNLNLYLERPTQKNKYPGYETFNLFYRNLNDYAGLKQNPIPTGHLEWRSSNNIRIGNVYTSYRRWIHDFGYLGMFILNGLLALIYNVIYNIIKYYKIKNMLIKVILTITFSYLYYSLITHSIDSTFYLNTFRLAFITQTIFLIIMYYLIIVFKQKKEVIT